MGSSDSAADRDEEWEGWVETEGRSGEGEEVAVREGEVESVASMEEVEVEEGV